MSEAEHEQNSDRERPAGREAVVDALIRAARELLVECGPSVSVREIATRATVNHGLVHTYFGSKEALLTAALNEIENRAAADLGDSGYPPADLATRRDAELARALARLELDRSMPVEAIAMSHPIIASWSAAARRDHPAMAQDEIVERVVAAASLALGWAVFERTLADAFALDTDQVERLDAAIKSRIAEIGLLP